MAGNNERPFGRPLLLCTLQYVPIRKISQWLRDLGCVPFETLSQRRQRQHVHTSTIPKPPRQHDTTKQSARRRCHHCLASTSASTPFLFPTPHSPPTPSYLPSSTQHHGLNPTSKSSEMVMRLRRSLLKLGRQLTQLAGIFHQRAGHRPGARNCSASGSVDRP
jgi:hypothetical protein